MLDILTTRIAHLQYKTNNLIIIWRLYIRTSKCCEIAIFLGHQIMSHVSQTIQKIFCSSPRSTSDINCSYLFYKKRT